MEFDTASQSPQPPSSAEPFASPRIERLLATAQTWCYVLACIGFSYVALTALRVGVSIAAMGRMNIELPLLTVFALALPLLFYGLPSWMLYRYAQQIGRFRQSSDPGQLPRVFAMQRQFWITTAFVVVVVFAGMMLVMGAEFTRMMFS